MLPNWMKLQEENECISMVTIPRFIGISNCQLLCFCDASSKAYASVILWIKFVQKANFPGASGTVNKKNIAKMN